MAEKLVSEVDEKGLLLASSGPRSTGSLHSMGTHDSSSSLDWTIDAVPGKVRIRACWLLGGVMPKSERAAHWTQP